VIKILEEKLGKRLLKIRLTILLGGLSDGLEDLGKYTAVGVAGRCRPILPQISR
jgi:hypothetical protein